MILVRVGGHLYEEPLKLADLCASCPAVGSLVLAPQTLVPYWVPVFFLPALPGKQAT